MAGFLFRLETQDGTPAEPPTLSAAVPNWRHGDAIYLGRRTLRVVGRRDDEANEPPVLIVETRRKGRGVASLLSSADNKGAGFPAPFLACIGTTQEVLAQRTVTWKLSAAAPSFAIVTWNPGAKGSTSWTANDADTVRSADGSTNSK
jgi:hypothetical protein